jgi:hypothetical protein
VHTEPIDTWVLVIADLRQEDEGTYHCHLGSDPAIKMAVHLIVDGGHCTAFDFRMGLETDLTT